MKQTITTILEQSDNIVFFGGAGVSTESGIPDFRSTDGLYSQKYPYPPETILSHDFFMAQTKFFFEFYKEKMIYLKARPNPAHQALAYLEKIGKLKMVITQNIDGLHQSSGSENVAELHGSIHRNYCMDCGKFYGIQAILESIEIPICTCKGIIKPDVVLYGEPLNSHVINSAIKAIQKADVLIVAGTSLGVYPAAGLIDYYRGNQLILINRSPTPMDSRANVLIQGSVGEVLEQIIPQ